MKKSIARIFALVLVMLMTISLFAITVNAETMYVSGAETGRVYLRVAPASSSYIALLNNGTAVNTLGRVIGADGVSYHQVSVNGYVGWITSRYLSYYSPYATYSRYTPARISGVNWGVYVWSSAWGSAYRDQALLGETVYVDWSTVTNGRVYGYRYNGVYGWFTTSYVR